MAAKRKFIIDTNAGLDDAQAILMALACPDVDVIAITTTHGNTDVNQVCCNVLRLLQVAGRLDIPLYRGSDKALLGKERPVSLYHGVDGFGDCTFSGRPDMPLIKETHAVNQMLQLVNKHPGEITIVALGPLTNLALALRMDEQFGAKLKDCFCMGGNYEGKGNVTPSAEFNFHTDPEAAYVVLNQLGCTIRLTCWELCLKYPFSWEWYNKLLNIPSMKTHLIEKIEKNAVETLQNQGRQYFMADQLAMACAIDNNIMTDIHHVSCTVELSGQLTTGQLVVDWTGQNEKQINVHLIRGINQDILSDLLFSALQL